MFILPLLILGGDVPYHHLDNLDSNVVSRKLLIENRLIFSDSYSVVPQIMSGLPRVSLGTEFNLFILLAKVFPPATSLAINRFLQIIVGFFGMFLLCRNHIIKNHNALPSAIVAILFAILPFWSSGSLSIAMQPLLLFSFFKIRDKKHSFLDWLCLVAYPFSSDFVVYGFFVYFLLFAIFCKDFFVKKRINWNLFFALCILFILSIAIQYRSFFSIFINNNFISHRVERTRGVLSDFRAVINNTKNYLLHDRGHASSNHYFILCFCSLFHLFKLIITEKINKKLILIILAIIAICFFTNLLKWQPIRSVTNNIALIRIFNIERFFTLFPLLWFVFLACTFNEIPKNKFTVFIFIIFFIFQFQYSIKHDFTYKGLYKKYVKEIRNHETLSFNDFYSESLFEKIKNSINKSAGNFRVAALGIHPAVLQYNGFYTIDGYCSNYDLNYKHLFGEMIRDELNKNARTQTYFDKWENRCYIFDDEIGRWPGAYKTNKRKTESLDIRYDILKEEFNCQYIISCVEIENLRDDLTLQQIFENSIYKIYLYKVL